MLSSKPRMLDYRTKITTVPRGFDKDSVKKMELEAAAVQGGYDVCLVKKKMLDVVVTLEDLYINQSRTKQAQQCNMNNDQELADYKSAKKKFEADQKKEQTEQLASIMRETKAIKTEFAKETKEHAKQSYCL